MTLSTVDQQGIDESNFWRTSLGAGNLTDPAFNLVFKVQIGINYSFKTLSHPVGTKIKSAEAQTIL